MLRKLAALSACAWGLTQPCLTAYAKEPTIPVSAYSRLPAVESVKLSPSGSKFVYI